MSNEINRKIFDSFFSIIPVGEDTDLGLAMVYGIDEKNRDGTKVPTIAGGSETILIVDDEPSILKIGTRILEGLGYQVLTAPSPNDAIRMVDRYAEGIDLLLTDVIMPLMNGRDLAEKLLKKQPEMKVLFMSGYTANVIAHNGVLDEKHSFIGKPFTRQILADKVRTVLGKE